MKQSEASLPTVTFFHPPLPLSLSPPSLLLSPSPSLPSNNVLSQYIQNKELNDLITPGLRNLKYT